MIVHRSRARWGWSMAWARALVCVLALALGMGALTHAAPVEAQEPGQTFEVAVFDVVSEGADAKLARQITQVMKTETRNNPHYKLVKQEDIALLDSLLLVGCEEPNPECMGMLADTLKAQRLVYGRLVAVSDLYDIEVNVYDLKLNKVVKRWNKRFTANADAIGFFVKEMEEFLGERVRARPTRLRVTANVADAYVVLDGQRVGRTPYIDEALQPGKHKIVVTREGFSPWEHEAEVEAGAELILRASLSREGGEPVVVTPPNGGGQGNVGPVGPPLADDGPPKPTPSSGSLATFGWVGVGVGAALVAAGGVFGALSLSTRSDFDATQIQREAHDLRDQGKTQATTANILFALGAVSGATGLVLIVVDSGDEKAPATAPAPTTAVSVGPVGAFEGVGVQVQGEF